MWLSLISLSHLLRIIIGDCQGYFAVAWKYIYRKTTMSSASTYLSLEYEGEIMFIAKLFLLVVIQTMAGSISPLRERLALPLQPKTLYSATIYSDGRPPKVLVDNFPSLDETRVQTGTPVPESDVYPFIGALGKIELVPNDEGYDVSYSYQCTASLIDKQTIITAAHCNSELPSSKKWIYLHSLTDVRVDNPEDYYKKKDKWITVTNIKTHPKYNKTGLIVYDIAVGRLEKPLEVEGVKPICLAEKVEEYTSKVIGAGWGLKDCYDASPETLRRANGKVYSTSECNELGASASDLHVCATFTLDNGEAAGVASGDSGSPLFSYADPNHPVQIGVLSYGYITDNGDKNAMCVDKETPQVYGRVSAMKSFINSIATEAQWC